MTIEVPIYPRGFVEPITGRVAVLVSAYAASDLNGDASAYWYTASADECGLNPWRLVEGVDPHVHGDLFDVRFASGDTLAVGPLVTFFVSARHAGQLAGDTVTVRAGLQACPCGQVPAALGVASHEARPKYAYAFGECCGEWHIEFRADYAELGSPEMLARAGDAWNNTQRNARLESMQPVDDAMVARAAAAYAHAAESEGFRSTEGMETHLRWMRAALEAAGQIGVISNTVEL